MKGKTGGIWITMPCACMHMHADPCQFLRQWTMNITSYSYTSLKMGISFSNWYKNVYITKGNTQKLQLGYVTLMKSWTNMVESSSSSVIEFVVLFGNYYLYFILRSMLYRLLFLRAWSNSRVVLEDLCKLQLVFSCCSGSSPLKRCLLLASGPTGTNMLVSLTFWVAVCVCGIWLVSVCSTQRKVLAARLSDRLWF